MSWRFSHWEGVRQHGILTSRTVWHPVYVWVDDPVVVHVHVHLDETDRRIAQYEKDARLARALQRKIDAEAALVSSEARLLIARADAEAAIQQLERVESRRLPSPADDVARLTYAPATPVERIR